MRPRTVDVDAERARLNLELSAAARTAHGDWLRFGTDDQKRLFFEYRCERSRILARLRQLRRIERHRARTDAKRRAPTKITFICSIDP